VIRVIAREPHGAFVANPRVSPDGTRIVATRFDGQRFRIVLLDARDGGLLATLPTADEPVHDASWIDDRRVVFLRGGRPTFGPKAAEIAGRMYRNLYDHSFFAVSPEAPATHGGESDAVGAPH